MTFIEREDFQIKMVRKVFNPEPLSPLIMFFPPLGSLITHSPKYVFGSLEELELQTLEQHEEGRNPVLFIFLRCSAKEPS